MSWPTVARPGYLRLSWPSEIGKAYQVQVKGHLEAFAWTNLSFVIPAFIAGGVLLAMDHAVGYLMAGILLVVMARQSGVLTQALMQSSPWATAYSSTAPIRAEATSKSSTVSIRR